VKNALDALEPAGKSHSTAPDPLAGFKGPTSKAREGKTERGSEEERKEGKKGRKGEGNQLSNTFSSHWTYPSIRKSNPTGTQFGIPTPDSH